MSRGDLGPASVAEVAAAIAAGTRSAVDLVDSSERALREADAGPEPVRAFVSTHWASARAHARAMMEERDRGLPGAVLSGIPVAVKDNLCTADFPTTCGSRLLEGYRSPFDATVVRRLREAGAILIGKTNLDEFAMGSSTEHSAFGATRNPLDRSRVAGGSSGGSAAAVAAGIVPVALGSDTGGSVRQPAAFCGVVGIKPTYGRISRYGLVAFASSLDHIGVFGATVADAELALRVIAGPDPRDSTSSAAPTWDPTPPAHGTLEGLCVGVPEEYFPDSLDARLREHCLAALRRLEALGATLREVSLPHTQHAIPTYHVIASAEASSNLARFDGVRFGVRAPDLRSVSEMYERTRALFGPEVKRRIMLGTYVLSAGHYDAYYTHAQRVRTLIVEDFRRCFASGVDVLFTPTTPAPAFPLGARAADPYTMYLSDVFTVTANLAGLPALSLPIGRVDGLPIGGQLIGGHGAEAVMIRVASTVEASFAATAANSA